MAVNYIEKSDDSPISDFRIKLPKKSYKLRCIVATFGKSKTKPDGSGNNPMLTRRWEVIEPESVTVVENETPRKVTIAGLQVTDNLVLTAKAANFVKADCARLGVEPPDDETPNLKGYEGKTGNAILGTEVKKAIDEETQTPIKNPDGTDKIDYRHSIIEWLG